MWVFRVPEQGRYSCNLQNIVRAGHQGTYHFTISGIPKNNNNQSFNLHSSSTTPHSGAINFSNPTSNNDSNYTGDRESDVLTIGDRKFKMIVIEDEAISGGPTWSNSAGCVNTKTGVTAANVTLHKKGDVWVFTVPEQGEYDCALSNFGTLTGSGSRVFTHDGSVLGELSNTADSLTFSVGNSVDNNVYDGTRTSNILTAGSYKFQVVMVDDELPLTGDVAMRATGQTDTRRGIICNGASGNKSTGLWMRKVGGVFEIVAEKTETSYDCYLDNVTTAENEGKYYFDNVDNLPKSDSHQSFEVLAPVKGISSARLKLSPNSASRSHTGDRRSSVLTIGTRKFQLLLRDSAQSRRFKFVPECTSASTHPAANVGREWWADDSIWHFFVPEEGKYSCTLENIIDEGIPSNNWNYTFNNLPGNGTNTLRITGTKNGLHTAIVTFRDNDDTVLNDTQNRRQSDFITITSRGITRKLRAILVDNEKKVTMPTCSPTSGAGASDATLEEDSNGVYVITVDEEGTYDCVLKDVAPETLKGRYYFPNLQGIPANSAHQFFDITNGDRTGKPSAVGDARLGFALAKTNDDDDPGTRESDVLTIGGRKFKLVVNSNELRGASAFSIKGPDRVWENAGEVEYTVELPRTFESNATVTLIATKNGAVGQKDVDAGETDEGADYVLVDKTITIPAGKSSGTFRVKIVDDSIYENGVPAEGQGEEFSLSASIGNTQSDPKKVIILDNEYTIAASENFFVFEEDVGIAVVPICISRVGIFGAGFKPTYGDTDTAKAGVHYTPAGSGQFAPVWFRPLRLPQYPHYR